MLQTSNTAEIGRDDLVVILFGLTAGWRKRRHTRRHFQHDFGSRAYLPWIPYALGLRASAAWISFLLRRRIARGGIGRIHFVLYIGGGFLLRRLHANGENWPIGKTVWDRSPLQEGVARRVLVRYPAALLTLLGYRSVIDLARLDPAELSFPASPLGAGLIVETKSSALALRLGISETTLDLSPEALQALLPNATASIQVPLSHDQVYEDPRFLDEVTTFLETGSFRATEQMVAE